MSDLPAGWIKARLRDLVEAPTSWNPRVAASDTFRYVDIEAIDNVAQRITGARELRVDSAPSRARVAIKRGDVLFSLVRPYLKNIARVPDDLDGQVASTAFVALRPRPGVASSFLFYRLIQDSFIRSVRTYGNSPPAARDEEFLGLEIPVAPSNEQIRIADKLEELLSDLDAGVAALERARANLRGYRASVLNAAVEGRLTEKWRAAHSTVEPAEKLLERILIERRERWERGQLAKYADKGLTPPNGWKSQYQDPSTPDTATLSELPKGWIWVRAEQVCDFITKGTTPSGTLLDSGKGDVPFLKVYNLTHRGTLDFSVNPTFVSTETHRGFLARSRVLPGDVLMNIVGPPLGKVSIVPEQYPEWNINQAIAIFRPVAGIDRRYLATCLLCEAVLDWAVSRGKATAGQTNLTLEICRDLPLPLPPYTEQVLIADEVSRLVSIAEVQDEAIKAAGRGASQLRQSVLRHAFEGKLVPQDPNDEPASRLLGRIRAQGEAEGNGTKGAPRKGRRSKMPV